MSWIFRQGMKVGDRVFVIGQRGIHRSLVSRRKCLMMGRIGTLQSPSVRRMTTTTVRNIDPVGFIFLIFPIGTFCLGTWQVQRRKWKLNLLAELDEKTKTAPVQFPENLEELEDLEYRRVKIAGAFDHSKEVFLGPRPVLVHGDVNQTGGGLISSGQSGFLVITPFKLVDRDVTVLVNRGWVPRKQKNPESRAEGQVEGLIEMEAVVRKTENRPPFMPDNTKGSLVFLYRDVPTMSRILQTSPVFLDAVDSVPGGPQGGQTRVTMRNEHLSYILTWYSLSVATAYLWFHRFVKGKALL